MPLSALCLPLLKQPVCVTLMSVCVCFVCVCVCVLPPLEQPVCV